MKPSILSLSTAGAALCLSLLSAPANAWWFFKKPEKNPEVTITETVLKSGGEFDTDYGDFDILLNAVTTAGLADALADPNASLTVFGPTDAAFVRLAQDLGYEGYSESEAFATIVAALTEVGGGDPIPLLTDILLYHVSPGEKKAWQVLYSGSVDTLSGGTILPFYGMLVDNDPEFANPQLRFWSRGINASNGVIYKIQRVLIPGDLPAPGQETLPTITGTVVASGGEFDDNGNDFDLLLNAVLAAGLEGALADPATPLTVFAPTDAAFVRLAQDLGYQGHSEADAFAYIVAALTELGGGELIPILTNVLLYHVSPDVLTLKQVVEAEEITTLLPGATLTPDHASLIDNAPKLKDPSLNLKQGDILTSNGRIHPITRVLIPVDIP